jgi:hypothetical protein
MRTAAPVTVLILAGTTVFIWLAVPAAGAHAAFGKAGSVLVMVVAMVASVAAAVLSRPGTSAGVRRSFSVALVALAVAANVLAFNHLSKADSAPEIGLAFLLWVVAIALVGGAVRVIRR